jgi:alpha-beta hydrolase superfamily lysophospholipase
MTGSGMRRTAFPLTLLALAFLAGCVPHFEGAAHAVRQPALTDKAYITADGKSLAIQAWLPAGDAPAAIILALHGYGDYANAFAMPGRWLAARNIAVYAYDQRGFGRAPDAGMWPGTDALVADFGTMAALLHARYPGVPLYALGESMGGAVVLTALARPHPPQLSGVILSAPAVWGRSTMSPVQSGGLWFVAHALPWMDMNGDELHIKPSDNVEMLRALSRDPLVQKEARADSLWGLALLMDNALDAAPKVRAPLLVLYGAKDFVIPKGPMRKMVTDLPPDRGGRRHITVYPNGYHMLLRDLNAELVYRDIAAWLADPRAPLPSGDDQSGSYALE